MDPRYSYYPSSPHDSSSSPHHQASRAHPYPRSSDSPTSAAPSHPYAYPQASLSGSVPAGYPSNPSFPQHHASGYHTPPSQLAHNALPPLLHGQGQAYSRDVTRHDVPSGFAVPSLGQTLHDIPFAAPRASSSSSPSSAHHANRHSGNWGNAQQSSRTPPLYDRQATYPPPRHGSQHPSLSHSTHLIPTPAQTAQTYHHGYPAGTPSPPNVPPPPVVASIPPASSSSPPQERYYCDKCDKSFGRAHDKKRHYESTHLQQSHMCRFCQKTFSRNDSLKRHQDNGCDKDPEFNP